ncbi:hypothetical protein BY996DRAFT_4597756 [Phakopsora pachyrhizi]|uniref:Mitochondrial carrier protein n=1 Tax=Phakopsora pachyrhizi TaxID=170000 RepID=A0AAV0ANP6_PHAPC|nr:hypothetical protein BY996DRAFT_4597756 [Phakopsora pachyrhizi]CAH7670623.1 hypothetical protein PPACK8108_LOCUS5357 [Phakopsora pachyrhizi]
MIDRRREDEEGEVGAEEDEESNDQSRSFVGPLPIDPGTISVIDQSSSISALARSAATSLGFIFKRPPIRFFRPVKISTYAALEAIAVERGQPVSVRLVRSVIRSEGLLRFTLNHFFPPFILNTLIGLTLFSSYSFLEMRLSFFFNLGSSLSDCQKSVLVPALAGAGAGAAQSLISAPLDNLRLINLTNSNRNISFGNVQSFNSTSVGQNRFTGWMPLIKKAFLPIKKQSVSGPDTVDRSNIENYKVWATRGWKMFGLSVIKDSVGFASFFAIFQVGREIGRQLARLIDRSIFHTMSSTYASSNENSAPEEVNFLKGYRTWTGRVFQSIVVVLSGATAGWTFGLVTEPFEKIRKRVWQDRLNWIVQKSLSHPTNHQSTKKSHNLNTRLARRMHDHEKLQSKQSIKLFRKTSKAFKNIRPTKIFNSSNDYRFKRLIRSIKYESLKTRIKTDISLNLTGMKSQSSTAFPGGGRPMPKISSFKSFVFSPYSIGFFVWAVCSGDFSE